MSDAIDASENDMVPRAWSFTTLQQAAGHWKFDEGAGRSITYAQPDGKTFKTEITAGPVRVRLGGRWAPIDTTLVEVGGKLRTTALAEGAITELSPGAHSRSVMRWCCASGPQSRWSYASASKTTA
ncbi:hypothetical protein FAF44_44090 [Nonomuraea sp. MG754425]|uniref:hypothetical protein n=1 Tax=Nonomuraea sp. MG754425 TaxID=2570319 RepID=UPI001F4097D3|nr:hypothetical protein [Nonomuraea sp. MG754425]MCF6475299.1 hypothetical protein [Nonomuraea sp. MG754425]